MSFTLAAVIPTRNRPADLVNAVASILAQTRPPDELIVVDQSPGQESAVAVGAMFEQSHATRLVYVHDTGVTGLVDAKRVGSGRATADIVCFLEDDVVLEPDYMAAIRAGFLATPGMRGCSGIITNLPWSSSWYTAAHSLFFRGIFHDPRVNHSVRALRGATDLVPCDVLSGGVSAWRREVFHQVPFDTSNGFFMLEDMEFSTRIVKAFGHCLYINPKARLEHRASTVNRDIQGTRQRRKLAEAMIFYKKRRDWPGARVGLAMVMVWWIGEAMTQAVRLGSAGPLRGYLRGVVEGYRKPLVQ